MAKDKLYILREKAEKSSNIMFHDCVLCKDDVIILNYIYTINLP